jgi:hypothetical protein
MKYSYGFGISLPKEIVKKIDIQRGDIPRSKYLLRILEKTYSPASSSMNTKHRKVERNESQNLLNRNGIGTPDDQANPSVHKRGNQLA